MIVQSCSMIEQQLTKAFMSALTSYKARSENAQHQHHNKVSLSSAFAISCSTPLVITLHRYESFNMVSETTCPANL